MAQAVPLGLVPGTAVDSIALLYKPPLAPRVIETSGANWSAALFSCVWEKAVFGPFQMVEAFPEEAKASIAMIPAWIRIGIGLNALIAGVSRQIILSSKKVVFLKYH
jgi:hypothetical protein